MKSLRAAPATAFKYCTLVTRDGKKSRQAAAQIAEWLASAWNGLAHDALVCAFVRAAHGHAKRCERGLRNDEFLRAGDGCGLVQPGALPRTPAPAR